MWVRIPPHLLRYSRQGSLRGLISPLLEFNSPYRFGGLVLTVTRVACNHQLRVQLPGSPLGSASSRRANASSDARPMCVALASGGVIERNGTLCCDPRAGRFGELLGKDGVMPGEAVSPHVGTRLQNLSDMDSLPRVGVFQDSRTRPYRSVSLEVMTPGSQPGDHRFDPGTEYETGNGCWRGTSF